MAWFPGGERVDVADYVATVEPDDACVAAYVPDLPGSVTVGATEEEALRLIRLDEGDQVASVARVVRQEE